LQWVDAWGAALHPADVKPGLIQVDLIPAQVHNFGGTKSVPVGDQDHGGVPVAVAHLAAGFEHRIHFRRVRYSRDLYAEFGRRSGVVRSTC